jgi:hypothetical protein
MGSHTKTYGIKSRKHVFLDGPRFLDNAYLGQPQVSIVHNAKHCSIVQVSIVRIVHPQVSTVRSVLRGLQRLDGDK